MTVRDVLKNDFRLIRRDVILFALPVFVVYLGVVLRFLLPWADGYLATRGFLPSANNALRLADYYPVVVSFLNLFTGAILAGATFGFLMLAEKDEETLKALLVSPLSPKKYLNYRVLLTLSLSLAIILFLFYVMDVGLLSFWKITLIALGAALTAPIIMLFLVIISDGRVQGLSYGKFISFAGIITLISWWIDEPLQLLFGLFPPYWISKAYWAALDGGALWLLFLGIGVLYQLMVIFLLRNTFIGVVYKTI